MDDARPIAAIFALTGFAVAVVSGLASGGDSSTTLMRALVALPICFAIGLFAGWAIRTAVREHVEEYQSGNPIPSVQSKASVVAGVMNGERKS
jgi:hypothetical protein